MHMIFGLAAAAAAIAQLCAHRDGIDQIFATDSDAAADETTVSAVKSIAAVPSLSSAAAAVPSIHAQTKASATGTTATGTATGTAIGAASGTVSGTTSGTATGTPTPTTVTGSSAMLAASAAEHHVLAHAIAYISQAARTHKSKSASASGGGGGDSATELRCGRS